MRENIWFLVFWARLQQGLKTMRQKSGVNNVKQKDRRSRCHSFLPRGWKLHSMPPITWLLVHLHYVTQKILFLTKQYSHMLNPKGITVKSAIFLFYPQLPGNLPQKHTVLSIPFKSVQFMRVPYACNPSYPEDRDLEDCGLKQPGQIVFARP
jgi:hypothetical protein